MTASPNRNPDYLDLLWRELQAAVIVSWRVDTPEVKAEVERALAALVEALNTS